MSTDVIYDKDAKVATAGSTATFYHIVVYLDPDGKDALMSLRMGDKEPLRYALGRLIDLGVKKVREDIGDDEE